MVYDLLYHKNILEKAIYSRDQVILRIIYSVKKSDASPFKSKLPLQWGSALVTAHLKCGRQNFIKFYVKLYKRPDNQLLCSQMHCILFRKR